MDVVHRFQVHFLAFALDIDHFAADKAVGAEQVCKDFDCTGVSCLAHEFKSEHAKGISCHYGRSLAKLLVAGGLAPAEVVVVDTGQVVVNEGEGVDHLQGDHSKFDVIALATKHVESSPNQGRPQALTARQHRIAHGLVQPAGLIRHRREVLVK